MRIFNVCVFLFILTGCASSGPGQFDSFAHCLTEKEVTIYGTEWCSHCQDQKAMFGSSFQYVDFVDCDINQDTCLRNGVTGYPTWIVENEKYPGVQSMNRLAQLSGCSILNPAITGE